MVLLQHVCREKLIAEFDKSFRGEFQIEVVSSVGVA